MIKRFTLVLLLSSVLASSLAWAWDNHPGLLADGQTAMGSLAQSGAGTDFGTDFGGGDSFHDHYCCHGYAHLLGLAFDGALTLIIPPPFQSTTYRRVLISHHPEVGTKPPRA